MLDDAVSITGYTLYRKDRHIRKGGGVCIFVKDNIKSFKLCLPNVENCGLEVLAILCTVGGNQFLILACYYPPKPVYSFECFKSAISTDLDLLFSEFPMATVIFAGDLNRLDCSFLINDLGLSYLKTGPTHGKNTLDKIYASSSAPYRVVTLKSLMKTKHFCLKTKKTTHVNFQNN